MAYKRMEYEEMRLKDSGEIVQVYAVDWQDNSAIIFSKDQYTKTNNGWTKVKLSKLVPLDVPIDNPNCFSKTRKNKAKSRMELIDATWRTSDGGLWKQAEIDKAIEHEVALMDREKNQELFAKLPVLQSD